MLQSLHPHIAKAAGCIDPWSVDQFASTAVDRLSEVHVHVSSKAVQGDGVHPAPASSVVLCHCRVKDDSHVVVNGKEIRIVSNRDPTKLPWKEMVSCPS